MVNHSNSNLCVVREFASEFESGECWGYNRFFKIELLREEGYLSDDDTILLRFFVRAPTYYQKCRDQKQYIDYLENSRNQAMNQLKSSQERYVKIESESEEVSVFDSTENPLEKIEEENRQPEKFDIKLENNLRLLKILKEERKSEEICKEQSANSANELSTVLKRYMMSPEEVSSSGSESLHALKWSEGEDQEAHSCSDIFSHDLLDSPREDQMDIYQASPESLG